MNGIVSNEYNGSTCAYSCQLFVFHLHNRVVFLSIQIDNSEMIVGFDKVIICDALDKLPYTYGQDVVGITHICELQMSGRVDVQEQIAHIVFAVRSHIMIDKLRLFSRHVGIGKDELRTLCLVNAHCEDTCMSIFAILTDTIVIDLFVGQLKVIDRTAFGDAFRSHFLKLHEMCFLSAKE